jgi:uncharacterized membrane protein
MIISKNAVAIIVLFLGFIGIEVGEDTIIEVVSAVLTIIGFVGMLWNQLGRRDTVGFFLKKKN